jgi:hypothetical protein
MAPPARPRPRRIAAGAAAIAAALLTVALAAPDGTGQAPEKPRDEQPEDFPQGPNREDAFYGCTACHGFRLVAAQGMSRARWDETISLMVTRHNMPDIQGAEREKILDYLETALPERKQPGGWKNPFAPR